MKKMRQISRIKYMNANKIKLIKRRLQINSVINKVLYKINKDNIYIPVKNTYLIIRINAKCG